MLLPVGVSQLQTSLASSFFSCSAAACAPAATGEARDDDLASFEVPAHAVSAMATTIIVARITNLLLCGLITVPSSRRGARESGGTQAPVKWHRCALPD